VTSLEEAQGKVTEVIYAPQPTPLLISYCSNNSEAIFIFYYSSASKKNTSLVIEANGFVHKLKIMGT
jgi:hypothetical protein